MFTNVIASILLATTLSNGAEDALDKIRRMPDIGNKVSIALAVSQTTVNRSDNISLRVSVSDNTSRPMIFVSEQPWEILVLQVVDDNGRSYHPTLPPCSLPNKRKYNDLAVHPESTAILESDHNNGFLSLSCYGFASLPAGHYKITAQLQTAIRLYDPSVGYLGGEQLFSHTAIRSETIAVEILP